MKNFVDMLCERVQNNPEKLVYRFHRGGMNTSIDSLSFYELWEHAAAFAVSLKQHGLQGERILIACKTQKNFIIAFFACLLAGATAVPTALSKRQHILTRMRILANDAMVAACVTDGDELQQVNLINHNGTIIPVFDICEELQNNARFARANQWSAVTINPDALALLQYTSGSTGNPKGVAISHLNLINNSRTIKTAMDLSQESVTLIALPLFHDMGLVGGVLQSIFSNYTTHFMSPSDFAVYPERWLQLMSEFQVTTCGGPNFLYDLAIRQINDSQLENINLANLRVAFCGAEPVRPLTVSQFTKRFAKVGFRPEAFYPCYGMAESTLFITGSNVNATPLIDFHHGSPVVSCGVQYDQSHIEIVNPNTLTKVAEMEIGEIWVSGDSIASGYWNNPELTESTFGAQLQDKHGDTKFLRTGDLGYIKNGELYVTGRLKDLIIIYGKKYAPQDIEGQAALSHSALNTNCIIAFSINKNNMERLVIVCELERVWLHKPQEWKNIITSIRSAVNEGSNIPVDEVLLLKPGALPRTSSGKVRRNQCRIDYLGNTIDNLTLPTTS